MVSGLVSFEQVVEAVKDETGIENLRNYYERIKRLMFRAEKDIGYSGGVILKKAVYIKNQNGFNGTYIPFPEDYVEHESLGNCQGPFRSCAYSFRPTGIRLNQSADKAVLLYWGVFCDGRGNPVTTHNHFEAVVAFVVWKMYSSRVYLNQGNFNAKKDFQLTYEDLCLAARGNDVFPTQEQWNELAFLGYQDRRPLIMYPMAGFDYCDDSIQEACLPTTENTNPQMNKTVYFWQEGNTATTVNDVQSQFESDKPNYFTGKNSDLMSVFLQGRIVNYNLIGRICFAIRETDNTNWQVLDALNNDVTDLFNTFYDAETMTVFFVSIENYTYSSIYFKFKELPSTPVNNTNTRTFDDTFDITFN